VSRPRFLLTFLAWSGGLSGGDRHLLEVAQRWRQHVDLAILAPPGAAATFSPLLPDVESHELGASGSWTAAAGPALVLEYVRRAVAVSRRELPRVDVAVAASHFLPDAAALASLARRGAMGVAYVYHLIEQRRDLRPRTLWSKTDERIALGLLKRRADLVFVSNTHTAARLVQQGFAPVHTAVGIDVGSFAPSDPSTAQQRAAFIGRMAHIKGVHDAVQAWVRVLRAVPDARLVMVGSGPEREPARALAQRLGVSASIEWPGFVSEEEKRAVLRRSRLFLAPSREEGWGIAVAEALASGVPVVAYRLPVLDELFGRAYVGVPVGDVEALAARTVDVLTDDAQATRLSREGREAVEHYDVARVAEQELEQILRRVPVR
jgi:glycosyltransferase involved in cell wall biosynthesis